MIIKDEKDMRACAARLGEAAVPDLFLALFGGLGAGKTTFVRGLGEALGTHEVKSPTFTIMEEHEALLHVDAYRLNSAQELYDIGFEEMARGRVVALEWAEKVADALPGQRLEVHIEGAGEGERRLRLAAYGEEAEALLGRCFA